MLATQIRIDGLRERNVRRVVAGDDGLRVARRDFGARRRRSVLLRLGHDPAIIDLLAPELLESPLRIDGRTAAFERDRLTNAHTVNLYTIRTACQIERGGCGGGLGAARTALAPNW